MLTTRIDKIFTKNKGSDNIQSQSVELDQHLSQAIQLVSAEDLTKNDVSRVIEMKAKIDANQYVVDHNLLSDKMIARGVFNKLDE
jgi:anti-sigma28 factor (negative regulator of flagellin synthesis)